MGFQKKRRDTGRNTCTGQLINLFAATARGFRSRRPLLEGMSHIEHKRDIVILVFHDTKAQNVHHEIVVTERRSPLADHDPVIATGFDLVDDVADLLRAQKLWLLHIDDRASAGNRLHQICLASKEGRDLQNVEHFGRRLCLFNFMHV